MRALGDPVRFRLLAALPAEATAEVAVGELAGILGVSGSVVSQHLRVLAGLGLVGHRRQGRRVHYFVRADAVRAARQTLGEALPGLFAPAGRQLMLSARNQLWGRVVDIHRGDVTTDVTIEVGGQLVAAVITNASADRLGLRIGDVAGAAFKALDVIVLK